MIYIDIRTTISSEELWFNREKAFWQGGKAVVNRLSFEEFEKALRYFTNGIEEVDATALNDSFWFTEEEEWEEIIGRKIWED